MSDSQFQIERQLPLHCREVGRLNVCARWLGLACALVMGFTLICHRPLGADEQADLERLLDRIGLPELKIVYLEDLLQTQTDRKVQVETARVLSEAYVGALLSSADDQAKFDDYTQRVINLIAQFREIDSPSLQVMMLQAEYLRAEKLASLWLEDRSQSAALIQAGSILEPILPKFQEMRKSLNDTIERLTAELGEDDSETLDKIREERIDRLTQVSFRATYFSGWSHYYWAVAQSDAEKSAAAFTTARDCFAEILALNAAEDYFEDLSPEWLPLSSIWVARSLLGLGVAEAGLRQQSRNEACFDLLGHPSVAAELRKQSGFWLLQSWLNINELAVAEKIAVGLLADDGLSSEEQTSGICVSLIRTGFSQKATSDDERARLKRLSELGVSGLMRLRRFALLTSLLDQYKIELEPTDFYTAWLKGYEEFLAAEKTKSHAGFEAAADAMQQAIAMPAAAGDVKSLAICRYHFAWAQFRLKKFDAAEKLLQQALPTLKIVDPDLSLQAAWLRFESLNELAKTDEVYRKYAVGELEHIIQDYPGTQTAKNAEYQLARIKRGSASPAEILRDLESITADNPNYLSARYEVCLLYHQLWQARRTDPSEAAEMKAKVVAAVDRFLRDATNERYEQRLRVALIAIDVNLRSEPPDTAEAIRYLTTAEASESLVSSGSSAVIEYHYQRFQVARSQGDLVAANQEAAWLTENGGGTAYQKSAIIQMARVVDQRVQEASGAAKQEEMRGALKVYEQMVLLFGDSAAELEKDKNARVSLSRLADYQSDLKMYRQAAESMQKLVAVFPTDQNYLRKCALAFFQAGEFEAALPHLRKLCDGLDAGSESWYEARYHLIYALGKTDPDSAKSVFQQFTKLYPDPGEAWQTKFAELGKMLHAN